MSDTQDVCQECLAKKWIKIRVVDEQNKPYQGISYNLVGSSETVEGELPYSGIIYHEELIDQTYQLVLPVWDTVSSRRLKPEEGTAPVKEWLATKPTTEAWQYQFHAYPEDIKQGLLADLDDGGKQAFNENGEIIFITLSEQEYFGHLETSINNLCVCTNHCVEIESLIAYVPVLIDTIEYHYVNAYNLAVASQWVYADWDINENDNYLGSLEDVVKKYATYESVNQINTDPSNFVVQTAPFADRIIFPRLMINIKFGAEALIACQGKSLLIFVRGTEGSEWDLDKVERVWNKELSKLPHMRIARSIVVRYLFDIEQEDKVKHSLEIISNSQAFKDVVSDAEAEQIPFVPAQGWFDKMLDDFVPIVDSSAPRVHKGFFNFFMALWECILKYHEIHKQQIENFFVAGHSLGGAGATLIAAAIKELLSAIPLLYTYGSPRVGTKRFVGRYKTIPHFRHVNNRDAVPMVPFQWVNGGLSQLVETSERQKVIFSSAIKAGILAPEAALTGLGQTAGNIGFGILDTVDFDFDNYLHHGELQQILTIGNVNFVVGIQSLGFNQQGMANLMYALAQQEGQDLRVDGDDVFKDLKHAFFNNFIAIDKDTLKKFNLDPMANLAQSGADHSVAQCYVPKLKAVLKQLLLSSQQQQQGIQHAIQILQANKKMVVQLRNQISSILKQRVKSIREALRSPYSTGIHRRDKLHRSIQQQEEMAQKEIDYYNMQIKSINSDIQLFEKMLESNIDPKYFDVSGFERIKIIEQL
ncbi:lipase family protein [Spartinivicinus ruber]|uniref:lipase family protein n=1 Tax=Spartinivicinus ruber TaxID=2683272 RepID=UPI0013D76B61|nr:lipase family protein [Spartinivicinus ruber]